MKKSPHFSVKSSKPLPKIQKTKGPSPIPKQAPGTFPMRINKYLAMKGNSTRRGADELIKKKFVIINGRVAVLGDKVEANDVVEIRRNGRSGHGTRDTRSDSDKNIVDTSNAYVYYAFNKPPSVELEVAARSLPLQNVFPVLSLDREARGLVILTNDRRIIDRLTYVPQTAHMGVKDGTSIPASAPSLHVAENARIKEYLIRTHNPLKHNFKEKLEKGVVLDSKNGRIGGRHAVTVECSVHIIKDNLFTLRTTDNGNHIRHVCSLFMAEVADLARIRIGTLSLGTIAEGNFRPIEGEELEIFLKELGL
jgi:16S rRNA U516 pseudouridylate synthase RsuA-like enzyme